MFDPADVVNQSLDSIGKPELQLGSIMDGTLAGRAARRIYGQTLRQLLRTAHWSMARKKAPLQLLADATGQTMTPQGYPYPATVEEPWRFAYAWPIDGLQARWMPWDGQFAIGNTGAPTGNYAGPAPLMTGLQQQNSWGGLREKPARFLCSTSDKFPPIVGQADWQQIDDLTDTIEGVGLNSRRIILTNVPPRSQQNGPPIGASLVYTALVTEIELWDALFRQAMVAVLAERLAPALITDKREMIPVRNTQIAIAKDAIREARVASANEAGFPQSTDQVPDWILARRASGTGSVGWGGGGAALGFEWYGFSSYAFGDGSVY